MEIIILCFVLLALVAAIVIYSRKPPPPPPQPTLIIAKTPPPTLITSRQYDITVKPQPPSSEVSPTRPAEISETIKPAVKKKKKKPKKISLGETQVTEKIALTKPVFSIQQQVREQKDLSRSKPFSKIEKKQVSAIVNTIHDDETEHEKSSEDIILEEVSLLRDYFKQQFQEISIRSSKIRGTYAITIFDPAQQSKRDRKQIVVSWRYPAQGYPIQGVEIKRLEISYLRLAEEHIRSKISQLSQKSTSRDLRVFNTLVELFELIIDINREESAEDEEQQQEQQQKEVILVTNKELVSEDQASGLFEDPKPKLQQMISEFIGVPKPPIPYFYAGDLMRNQQNLDISDSINHTQEQPNSGAKSRYLKQFQQQDRLGQGGFGVVYKAKNKIDSKIYAIKKILLNYCQPGYRKTIKEVTLLSQLDHENIVRYYQSWIEDVNSIDDLENELEMEPEDREELNEWYQKWKEDKQDIKFGYDQDEDDDDDNMEIQELSNSVGSSNIVFGEDSKQSRINEVDGRRFMNSEKSDSNSGSSYLKEGNDSTANKVLPFKIMYIAMEYCEGLTLKDYIEKLKKQTDSKKTEDDRLRIIRGILEALVYLHDRRIIHRDLKPANIFLDKKGQKIKLGDFGLATCDDNDLPYNSHKTEGIGTPLYRAPEQTKSGKYNEKVDIYSMGVILFELYYKFDTNYQRVSVLSELAKTRRMPTDFEKFCQNVQYRELIKKLVDQDPQKRPSARALLMPIRNKFFGQLVSTITNPNHFEFKELLTCIFRIKNPNQLDAGLARDVFKHMNYETLEKVFKSHGALNIHVSPLIPVQDYTTLNQSKVALRRQDKYLLLSQQGSVLQFSSQTYIPWIRWIKEVLGKNQRKKFSCVKRYSFTEVARSGLVERDLVYKERIVGVFDIVYPNKQPCLEFECEAISVSYQIGLSTQQAVAKDHDSLPTIELSHSELIKIVCHEIKLNQQLLYGILFSSTVFQDFDKLKIDKKLEALHAFDIQGALARRLINILDIMESDLEDFITTLTELLGPKANLGGIIRHLEELTRMLKIMKVDKIKYSVMLPPQNSNGILWRIAGSSIGFSAVQEDQKHKKEHMTCIHLEVEMSSRPKRATEVFVWSIGEYLQKDILEIVSQLWRAGIHAEFTRESKGEKVEGVKVGLILKRLKGKVFVYIRNFQNSGANFECARENFTIEMVKSILAQ